jgi:hypothetical protein
MLATLVEEMETAINALSLPIEGLRDLLLLNLLPSTRVAAESLLSLLETRRELLLDSLRSLDALLENGYPSAIRAEVEETILLDIRDQAESLQTAATFFTLPRAASLGLSVGAVSPKET